MERLGRKVTQPMLFRLGWIASAAGLALLAMLWIEGSDDIIDWCEGLFALSGRPLAGWAASRLELPEQRPPQ
jgi:hypothetical protein